MSMPGVVLSGLNVVSSMPPVVSRVTATFRKPFGTSVTVAMKIGRSKSSTATRCSISPGSGDWKRAKNTPPRAERRVEIAGRGGAGHRQHHECDEKDDADGLPNASKHGAPPEGRERPRLRSSTQIEGRLDLQGSVVSPSRATRTTLRGKRTRRSGHALTRALQA